MDTLHRFATTISRALGLPGSTPTGARDTQQDAQLEFNARCGDGLVYEDGLLVGRIDGISRL